MLLIQFGIPVGRQVLFYENRELNNSHRLDQLGIKEHAMLFLQMAAVAPPVAPQGKLSIKDMIKNVAQQVNNQGVPPQNPVTAKLVFYKKEAEKLKK